MSEKLKWYYAFGADEVPLQLTPEDAVNYAGPFDTPFEAFSACLQEHGKYEDMLREVGHANEQLLRDLAGYRGFVHSCIKNGEMPHTFEQYVAKMHGTG